ncbi:MAG: cytochrome c biogenesis protein CcsA [Thermodesulfovibrionales bacterium]
MNVQTVLVVLSIACYVFGYSVRPAVFAGFLLQIVYLFLRGTELGRIPLVGPHDTLFFLGVSVMAFGLPIASRLRERGRFLSALIGLAVLFTALSLFYPPHNTPLTPTLRTFWFETHVAFSFFSYALYGIAAILGFLYLNERKQGNAADASAIELLQYKAVLVGYFLFSSAMIFGGIWAFYAWGTYWLWTPKELWTVILWLFYSLYLHARLRNWWAGRPAAVLGIVGFGIVLFTYLGVSLLMKSSHTF